MRKQFDFERLLRKYSVTCQLLPEGAEGVYVGGEWVQENVLPPEWITGIILPVGERKIFQSGGTYTEHDREFITITEIPLEPVHCIVYKGMKYQVHENTDYSDYTGFHAYNLKRVSTFDRPEKD